MAADDNLSVISDTHCVHFSHIAEFYLLESLRYINTLLCIFVIVSADINVLIYVGIKVLCFRRFKLIINANSQSLH